jgi:hypothetical protein
MSSRKHHRQWMRAVAAVALGCGPVAALALDAGGGATYMTVAAAPPPGCAAPGLSPLEPTAEAVKGAPYSGVGTTEVVTTLADGNRITRTNTMRYFRDSSGRMRTEYQLGAIGPFVPEESQSIVTITDPVAGKRYVLSPARKRADVFDLSAEKGTQAMTGKAIVVPGTFTSIGAPAPGLAPTSAPVPTRGFRVFSQRSGRGAGGSPSSMMAPGFAAISSTDTSTAGPSGPATAATPPAPVGDVFFVTQGAAGVGCGAPNTKPAPQAVSIGERRIEGLKVTGSRLEFTIGAGEVGNEQPITVRTDQWFSPELGVVVASTHNDPMIGEQTYRLEQINRAEPDPALFTVPADYSKNALGR